MPKSTRSRGRKLMGEINVVPYIDVMLVLLIIFMIKAPLLTQGIKVDLPDAGAEPLDPDMLKQHQPLVLSVDAKGRLYLNIGRDKDRPIDETTVMARAAAVSTERRRRKSPNRRRNWVIAGPRPIRHPEAGVRRRLRAGLDRA